MSEVNYYLKTPKNNKEKSLIYLFFSFNGKRLKYSTQEHISPTDWNPSSQKARGNNDINDFLKKLTKDVESIERGLRTDGVNVTPQLLRDKLDVLLERKQSKNHTFYSFIEDYIEKVKLIKKESSIKSYNNTLTHLKNFKAHKKRNFDFADINMEFYNDFINYLTTTKKFANNTIGKQIKNIKVFIGEAFESGLKVNPDYKSRKFKVFTEDVDSIYLNEKELTHLYNLDLSKNLKLDRVRDLFIVGCWTGLRFSDFSTIKPENIKNGFIHLKTIKMNTPVVIPIHKVVLKVMSKYKKQYDNSLPPALSNQKMNEYLKDIGELAKFNDRIEIVHTKAAKRVTEVFNKYELITTHTARRSFATNLYLDGLDSANIMKITGHKTEKAFMRYIKVTPEQYAQKLKKHWENKLKSPIKSK